MKRIDFLRALGITIVAPSLAAEHVHARTQGSPGPAGTSARSNCVLVPSETAGPFPLDLSENEFFFRQEIQEDRVGVRLRQRVRIIGAGNCEPMPNVRVNIWHCDRDGVYSGYASMGSDGETWCRGYQFTDANGECEFVTIFPGWYPGRVTHVHFQVHVSSQYSVVSQWTWPHADAVDAVESNADLYPAGPDPLSPEQDGVFANGYDLQLADLEWDADAGEYVSLYEATVEGDGTSGVGYQELRNSGVFTLGQNFPNPASERTTIPFELHGDAQVAWSLWSTGGLRVHQADMGHLPAGVHRIEVDFSRLGLPSSSYVYQLEVSTPQGRFTDVRRMTARRG